MDFLGRTFADMTQKSMFRQAALRAMENQWLGSIVISRPAALRWLTISAAVIIALLATLLAVGSYTRRETVTGLVQPDTGVIRLYGSRPGVVIKKNVSEGQKVKKGDVLYIISNENLDGSAANLNKTVSELLLVRRQSFRDELVQTRQLQSAEKFLLQEKLEGLKAELSNIDRQLIVQRSRVELAETAAQRALDLFKKGYISSEMLEQKQGELLDQRSRLDSLHRERISLSLEWNTQLKEKQALPLRHRNQINQIERALGSSEQEWHEAEGRRLSTIVSPEAGVATAINAEVGQRIDAGSAVASVLPTNSQLEVHLFAPSRASGFVKRGDSVLLRFQAYPYQRFGQGRGTVVSISKVALSPSEIAGKQNSDGGQQFFRIIVSLGSQYLEAKGTRFPIQNGMVVEADILQEQRRLYEWLLEPLRSYTAKH